PGRAGIVLPSLLRAVPERGSRADQPRRDPARAQVRETDRTGTDVAEHRASNDLSGNACILAKFDLYPRALLDSLGPGGAAGRRQNTGPQAGVVRLGNFSQHASAWSSAPWFWRR